MILEAFAAQAALAKQAVSLHMAAGAARAVSIAIAAVFLLFALGFAAGALFFVLEQSMSPAAAALWVALLLALLAGLAWMLGVLVARPRTRAAKVAMTSAMAPLTAAGLAATRPAPPTAAGGVPPPPPSAHALMLDHGMAVGARAHAALAAHPVGLLAAGLGAGLLFGLSAGVRRGVRRLLPW